MTEFHVQSLSAFLAWMPQPVFPHHDDGRAGYVDQFGEFGLSVSVSVPPIFEPLHAGRLCPDEVVVDWSVFTVGPDGVEESCVGVLAYREFSSFDDGGEWFRCHGFLFPFVWCRGVEEFLYKFLAFLGESPSPAWSFPFTDAVSVYTADVSCSFEFNHAAPQALWRVAIAEH